MDEGQLALFTGALLAAGVLASLLAGRLRLPGLVLVLALGMLIGSDVLQFINFHDFGLARTAAVLALGLILFEGGLSAGWAEVKPQFTTAIRLATFGTVLTAVITGLVASLLLPQLTTTEAILLGSTVAATDAAAVFAVLRGSTLRRRLARALEGESGINDPVAIVLVLGCIEVIEHPGFGLLDGLWLAFHELAIGAVAGIAVGALAVIFFRRARLPSAGLYPVASIAFAGLAFGSATVIEGSGFLAAYLAGLVIGSYSSPARRVIETFHDGVAWVAQLSLFLLLGLLVDPADLPDIALDGTIIAIVTAVIARPLAAVVVTLRSGFSLPEQLLLGWAGLRGATPIVFAIFPVTENLPHGRLIFDVAFFVVLLSTVVQGATIEPVARWLGVTSDEAAIPAPLIEPVILNRLGAEAVQFPVREGDAVVGHPVRDLGLPREALLNIIVRGDRAIPPRGSTIVEPGDQLHVLVRQEVGPDFRDILRRWRAGPVGAPPPAKRRPRSRPSVTSVRPWPGEPDAAARPSVIAGHAVVGQLRTRRDVPGALVLLADGRYAIAGPLLAIGPAAEMQAFARRRLLGAESPSERAWWREVVGALAG